MMTPQVKQRIEQIRRGEVPEGYKKTKIGIVPSEWKETTFSDLFTSTSNYTEDLDSYPLYSLTIEDGITAKTERYERSHLVKKENAYKIVRPNDFAYNPMNVRFGAVARHKGDKEVSVSGYYDIFTTKLESDLKFMDSFLISDKMIAYYNKVSIGSLVEKQRVHFSQFMDFILPIPSISERNKISDILSAQDKLIALKEKLLEEKKSQKKHIVHEILSQNIKLQKQDGSKYSQWDTNNIGTYLTSRNTKQIPTEEAPLMAFVADVGVVPKGERYDRSFLVKSDEKEYKRTELNDFIYSSNNLDVGSIGLNNYGSAVISVVYEIFSVNSNAIPIVISEIIQMKSNINKILRYRQGALYGQYRIFAEDFLSVNIDVPSLEEQQAIAKIMLSFEKEIELLQQELEQHKQKKKALMQLLLTGIVRVNR